MARQSKRQVAETPLWSINKVVNVASSHGDDTTDQIRALFRHEGRVIALFVSQKYLRGMVIGHRVGESREHGRLGIGRKGGRVEAKVSNRIYLEDRIAGDIPGNRVSGAGSSGGVVKSRRRILRAFFKAWPSRFLPYQESGE